MSLDLKYKKPSALFNSMVSKLVMRYKAYRQETQVMTQELLEQAKKEGIPDEQLRKIITQQLRTAGLSDRTIRRALPDELKNQNMIRKQPKKEPLVKTWQVEADLEKLHMSIKELAMQQCTKVIIIHDNRRVIDVQGK